ncbi:DUF6777 domain-containing protein [Nakamurella sp.]|uniref:DUF6777 domain-containing protein n=1 Tax=Nakamurella sp. TaxID=1869182 RepID=UPI003B3B36B7
MSDLPPVWPSPAGPPPPPPPPPSSRTRRPAGPWIALGVAIAVLLGAGATALILVTRPDPVAAAEPVLLEPAADPGPDVFVSAVAVSTAPTLPDEVRSVAAATVAGMTVDPVIGIRTGAGTTDALYGGSGDLGGCDPERLVEFLTANRAQGAAWAGVHGLTVDQIAGYVADLTPVVLLHDTAVTNYGFAGGAATPRQSILQAGTAVLVDATGTPAVRCACGNPLTAPTVRDLPSAELLGTRWAGFDPGATLAVTAGPRTTSFTLVDVVTGATYQRPAGLAALTRPALLAATPAGIQRSTDAQQWETVATVAADAGALIRLDAGPDLVVAVGGMPWTGVNQPSGVIRTTADGEGWNEPIAVQDHLLDVAFGNGTWLAVGQPGPDEAKGKVPVYRSTDGITWDRQLVTLPTTATHLYPYGTIAFGGGAWLLPAVDDVGDLGIPLLFRSTDGVTWTDVTVPGPSATYAGVRAFNGQAWGVTGSQFFFDGALERAPREELRVGGSPDGITWQPVAGTPVALALTGLSCTADRGWLASAIDTTATDAVGAVHTSADLLTWSPLGIPPAGGITDVIAVGAGTEPDAARCGAPAAPAAPADGGSCALDQTTADGTAEVAVVESGSIDCSLMRDRWTAYFQWTGPKAGTGAFAEVGDGWTCSIVPLSATLPGQTDWGYRGQVGGCRHEDGREFTVYPIDRVPSGGSTAPAPAPSTTAGPTASGSAGEGDLGLSRPISRPACDGTGIVILHSSVDPAAYASEMQTYLDRFPDAQYLRTDLTGCSSLNRVSQQGTLIYAAYLPVGPDQTAVCAAQQQAGAAYSKWLDNTSDPNGRIACG